MKTPDGKDLLFSSSGPLHQFPEPVCGAISLFNCTVCLLFPKGADLSAQPPFPEFTFHPTLSQPYPQVCSVVFLIGGWAPLLPLLTSPDLTSSHCHCFLWPWNPQPYLSILLGWASLSALAPLPGFPQMGLPLHAGAGLFLACEPVCRVATSTFSFAICTFVSLLVALHCSPSLIWGLPRGWKVYFSLYLHSSLLPSPQFPQNLSLFSTICFSVHNTCPINSLGASESICSGSFLFCHVDSYTPKMYTTVYVLCVYACVWELLEALLAQVSASHDGSA